MYRLKNDFKIPQRSLSENIIVQKGILILKNENETFTYKNNKWYISNDLVKDKFLGYGVLPTFVIDYHFDEHDFNLLFEEVKEEV